MNILYKTCIILVTVLLAACAKESSPQVVYENYIITIQKMDSIEDRSFEKYISNRAKNIVGEKVKDVSKEQMSSFLTYFKAEAMMPDNPDISLQEQQDSAILTISADNHPEQGSKQVSYVNFIQEDGWKIDKIIIETSGENFNFKSTTY